MPFAPMSIRYKSAGMKYLFSWYYCSIPTCISACFRFTQRAFLMGCKPERVAFQKNLFNAAVLRFLSGNRKAHTLPSGFRKAHQITNWTADFCLIKKPFFFTICQVFSIYKKTNSTVASLYLTETLRKAPENRQNKSRFSTIECQLFFFKSNPVR